VVGEVVDALRLLEVDVVEVLADPLLVGPNDVPLVVAAREGTAAGGLLFGFFEAWAVLEGLVDCVVEDGFESDCTEGGSGTSDGVCVRGPKQGGLAR
jgi:hypothetical protein